MSDKLRQTIYNVGTVSAGVLTLLTLYGAITAETSDKLQDLIEVVMGVVATGGLGTAAAVLKDQRKKGVLEPPPPEQVVVDNLGAIGEKFNNVVSDVISGIEQVQKAAGNLSPVVVPAAPVLGPLAEQVIQVVRHEDEAAKE